VDPHLKKNGSDQKSVVILLDFYGRPDVSYIRLAKSPFIVSGGQAVF
jgi:hypothetical protein